VGWLVWLAWLVVAFSGWFGWWFGRSESKHRRRSGRRVGLWARARTMRSHRPGFLKLEERDETPRQLGAGFGLGFLKLEETKKPRTADGPGFQD
jgi:hypothetical protein